MRVLDRFRKKKTFSQRAKKPTELVCPNCHTDLTDYTMDSKNIICDFLEIDSESLYVLICPNCDTALAMPTKELYDLISQLKKTK